MIDAGGSPLAADMENVGFDPLEADTRSADDLENEIAELWKVYPKSVTFFGKGR